MLGSLKGGGTFQELPEQPAFEILPLSLRAPMGRYYPPVFHYGVIFDEDNLERLCHRHANTYPDLRPEGLSVISLMEVTLTHCGYMRARVPTGCVNNEEVDIFSFATNYYPWVEKDRMAKIKDFLGEDLGELKWFVDPWFMHWNEGAFDDDGIAIKPTGPFKLPVHPPLFFRNARPHKPFCSGYPVATPIPQGPHHKQSPAFQGASSAKASLSGHRRLVPKGQ